MTPLLGARLAVPWSMPVQATESFFFKHSLPPIDTLIGAKMSPPAAREDFRGRQVNPTPHAYVHDSNIVLEWDSKAWRERTDSV